MTAAKAYAILLKALDTRMPDTELLGQGTADELTKRRMRILNATAQAMIEEAGGEEMKRHTPHYGAERCSCGYRYAKPLLWRSAHRAHQDRIMQSIIDAITKGVKGTRQINWHDVKEEADQWQPETSEPKAN